MKNAQPPCTMASVLALALALASTQACANSASDLSPLAMGEGTMHLSIRSTLVDVPSIHVDVTQDSNSVASQDLSVGSQPIPGDANHVVGQGGDALFLLATGKYDVTATPMAGDGNSVSGCTAAKKTGISVKDGQTTEIVLVIHCDSPSHGLLDTVVVIESAPVLETFTVSPNKFPCATASVAIQAAFTNSFGDVTVTAEVADGPSGAQPALNVSGEDLTFSSDVAGDYTLAITGAAPLGTQTTQQIVMRVQPANSRGCAEGPSGPQLGN